MNRPAPSSTQPTLVRRQDELDDFCRRFHTAERFAFDTEFVMEDRYETDVCLIQLADDDGVALIDPFLNLDLTEIWALVCDDRVETIVHAGQEDLALCVQHTGNVPRRVFDVQIAAGLAGYEYPISLQKLVHAALNVRLHKSKTLTNWRKRPLTSAQLRYAADDVRYLPALRTALGHELHRLGRTDWIDEESRRFEQRDLYTRAAEEKLRRVKGAGSLKGRELAVLHDVLTWRDELAQKWNRPPRAVLKDHLAVEIARTGINSYAQVRELRGINLSDASVRALCRVVKTAMEKPKEDWPQPQPRDAHLPREEALLALLTALIRSYCLDHDLAYSLVATKTSIRQLVRHRLARQPGNARDVELLSGWRGRTIGPLITDVLEGRKAVHTEIKNGHPHLRLRSVPRP